MRRLIPAKPALQAERSLYYKKFGRRDFGDFCPCRYCAACGCRAQCLIIRNARHDCGEVSESSLIGESVRSVSSQWFPD